VARRGLLDRARFVLAPAENLAGIADASVDIVTARSVLIYIADKAAAFSAMHRVLRPYGRISLSEPINRLTYPEPRDRFWGFDVGDVIELADKVKRAHTELQDPAAATMTDFDDRDLLRFAEEAGFGKVRVVCEIDVQPAFMLEPQSLLRPLSLETFLDMAPSPLAPTVGETIRRALDDAERTRFLSHLERALDERRSVRRTAVAYVTAGKQPSAHRRS
jgi:SAM-dependent methyltransferase